jgi:adenosine kinase
MKITVTGSIAFDYLMSFPGRFAENIVINQIENISLSFLVESLKRQRGGTAPNIAYTLALLNGRPKVMATAGQDFDDYRAWLEAQGVDTSGIVQIAEDYCASFFVNTDRDQNQIASFYTGAMAHAGLLSYAEHAPETELTIISPNDPGAMKKYVSECKTAAIPYIYDPSQQTIWLTGEDLLYGFEGCRLLTVNEYELSLIQQKTGLEEADIRTRVGGLLVTKAEKGACLIVDGEEYHIPSVPPQQIVDPTGAGDAFRAGLMRGMQLGLPWPVAGRMGALCATYVLEQLGTQRHHFTREAFVARYRQHFDDEGALDGLLT